MLVTQLCTTLFPNGVEAYTYSYLRSWLCGELGLSARQAVGVVGAATRYGYITVAVRAKNALGEAIFTR